MRRYYWAAKAVSQQEGDDAVAALKQAEAEQVVLAQDERPLDRVLEEIDAVGTDTLTAVAQEFFAPERQTIVRLGPGN